MGILQPDYLYKRIEEIPVDALVIKGIKAAVLDLDNTLSTHGNPIPVESALNWLKRLEEAGINAVILSNNSDDRVKPFAEKLGISYLAAGGKPFTKGFVRCEKLTGSDPAHTVVIGDQIFTDVIGGKLYGAMTILVEPLQFEDGLFFRFKRKMEKHILKHFQKGDLSR